MSFTGGVFTPTVIGRTLIKEQDLVGTSRMSELNQPIVAGLALANHQDPFYNIDDFGKSCSNTSTYTLRSASLEAADKTITCALRGTVAPGSEALELNKEMLTLPQQFFIKDIECANAVQFADKLAYMSMKAKVAHEVALSKLFVSKAITGLDTPVAADFKTTGTVNGSVYEVATANYSSDLLADIQAMGIIRDLNMPIVLNGRAFYNEMILEKYKSDGCCTNDAILDKNQTFDVYWDLKNVDSTAGVGSTLIIDKNSLLFWSNPVYSNMGITTAETQGREAADRYHYVDTLPRFTYFANGAQRPVYVDVRMERSCELDSLGVPRDGWKFEFLCYGSLTLNLQNQDGNNGIYKIQEV